MRPPLPARQALDEAGFTGVELADMCGASQPSVSRWLTGAVPAPAWFRGYVAGVLGRPVDDVWPTK